MQREFLCTRVQTHLLTLKGREEKTAGGVKSRTGDSVECFNSKKDCLMDSIRKDGKASKIRRDSLFLCGRRRGVRGGENYTQGKRDMGTGQRSF